MELAEGVLVAARIVVGAAFAIIGVRNIGNHADISAMLGALRYPMPRVLAACGVAMQTGFGALMVSGVQPAIAAAGLLAFTVLATLMVHSFWTYRGEERTMQINMFLANTIMAGGLLGLLAAGL